MIYSTLSLKLVSIVLGLVLIATHLPAAANPVPWRERLRSFPRHQKAGLVLLAVAVIWTVWVLCSLNIGNFHKWRPFILMAGPVVFFLVARFVPDFLAVRALGCLLLLGACPLLKAAFLRDEPLRLVIVVLAYAWVLAGMFFVGMPYLLRDWIGMVTRTDGRLRAVGWSGVALGAVLVLLGILVFG